MHIVPFQHIALDETDSTNNYAMRYIDGNKAEHGVLITANSQTHGKGQRGRTWVDEPGNSLLMTLIIKPKAAINQQFVFNCGIAKTVADALSSRLTDFPVKIKWPNDLILNDKKTGGLLVENVLRGSVWTYALIGLGLNINQEHFPADLPWATSLHRETGIRQDIDAIRTELVASLLDFCARPLAEEAVMNSYNVRLYKAAAEQQFLRDGVSFAATVQHVNRDGTLSITHNGLTEQVHHGAVTWVYGA